MRYLPIFLLSIGLLVVVMLMSGNLRQGFQAVRKILFAVAVMIVLSAAFAVILDRSA